MSEGMITRGPRVKVHEKNTTKKTESHLVKGLRRRQEGRWGWKNQSRPEKLTFTGFRKSQEAFNLLQKWRITRDEQQESTGTKPFKFWTDRWQYFLSLRRVHQTWGQHWMHGPAESYRAVFIRTMREAPLRGPWTSPWTPQHALWTLVWSQDKM